MDLIYYFIDFVLHLDAHLNTIVSNFGMWTYVILFLIIFSETGLVVTPVLPGDSLLFAVGIICVTTPLRIEIIIPLLIFAAILGDTCNYWIGRTFGDKAFKPNSRILKTKHLERTHAFFDKYGAKAIVIARFVPIVRTFVPFCAGMGYMPYRRFITLSILAAIFWVNLIALAGYFFSNIPVVKDNFGLVIIAIILVSLMPVFIEVAKKVLSKKAS